MSHLEALLLEIWPYLALAFSLFVSGTTSVSAILYKRDPRSAVLWVGFIWLAPVVGAVLFLMFGVNRVRMRAQAFAHRPAWFGLLPPTRPSAKGAGGEVLPEELAGYRGLADMVGRLVQTPLHGGSRVEVLVDGDEAYPAMLRAIDEARLSVGLASYIFDNDRVGKQFAEALGRAHGRGVQVRVLVDDAGARYSLPSISGRLKRLGVRTARFLPTLAPWRLMTMNLRNHRKLMVVDGERGFTGGINIREGHQLSLKPSHPVRDLHFLVEGPVVDDLRRSFADDWQFTTGEELSGAAWNPVLRPAGEMFARGIADGPDINLDRIRLTLLGALSCARESATVVTPYFIPDATLISALNVAAMRGVRVRVVLPERGNLRVVDWASAALWWQVLSKGCEIWLTRPPFDHSKLFLVDDAWTLIGSANWDERSLRLNFEFNVECYGAELAKQMLGVVDERLKTARRVTLEEMDARPGLVRFRDGVARLFSPYL